MYQNDLERNLKNGIWKKFLQDLGSEEKINTFNNLLNKWINSET